MSRDPHHASLGSLALSAIRVDDPTLLMRAARWQNSLVRLGVCVPFFITHDLGMLLLLDPRVTGLQARTELNALGVDAKRHAKYVQTIAQIAKSEVMHMAREWKLDDELIAVVLLRILGSSFSEILRPEAELLPLSPDRYERLDLAALFRQIDRRYDLEFMHAFTAAGAHVRVNVEQIDLDTLHLLGMFGSDQGDASRGMLGLLDLLRVFESAQANDVVNFSLDLLPSVLETKRSSGQQSFAVDGYSGVARHGTLDSLMLSELAFDDDLFVQRFLEREVFYYAHEKQHEEDRKLHYLMVDASASMRGRRSVFARGLALTLVKKLALQGEDVYLRFFDSKLYEPQHAPAGKRGSGISVPEVLSFVGERGRNYPKVFRTLDRELEALARREKRSPVLYILTHAECHLPSEIVESLRSKAYLYGIFMLPSSGELDLQYLELLHQVQVVTESALKQREEGAQRALEIVDDAAAKHMSA